MRETFEEAAIPQNPKNYKKLDSLSMIPRSWIGDISWTSDIFVVPEYCFAVFVNRKEITLSSEHQKVEWLTYEEAFKRYRYEANKIALWELNER